MSTFGERLRKARLAADLTQEVLGFELGVSKASVSAWENNREMPSFRLLPSMRDVLGVSLDVLIYGDSPSQQEPTAKESQANNAQELLLLKSFRRSSPARKKALLQILTS